MKLSVVIPTKDRDEILALTLDAAVKATLHVDAEIIVVNDSKTDTLKMPKGQNVMLLDNPKSGVAAARNFGFKNAKGDLILFLDNDILISKESVDHILKLHFTYRNACFNLNWEYSPETLGKIVSLPFSRFLKASGMTSFKGWYNDTSWRENELFVSKSVASFHLSISREDFEKSRGYNEQFPHAGFEDYDFPIRLKNAGIKFYIDSRMTVYHNELDRLKMENWLISEERRAVTRKKAVRLGYTELELEYHPLKKILLKMILGLERIIMIVAGFLPNNRFFDPAYFKIIAIIQASRIFKGYTSA